MSLPLLTATARALRRLEYAAQRIGRLAGRPVLYGAPGLQWYRYPDTEVLQIIAVKLARAVSGLNASLALLHRGYTVEMAVVLRTVDDFLDEITFLLEAHQSGQPTAAQKDFIDHFFSEEVLSTEELLQDRSGPDRARRKDVRAAQARYIGQTNPDKTRRNVQAIDRGWDGYVHGAYPHSMELFDPNLDGGTYRFQGTDGTPHPRSYQRQLGFYVSRALTTCADICIRVGDRNLADELIGARDDFEDSSEYDA